MKNEFIPYPLALRMKALGYDEPCIAYATMEYKDVIHCGIGFKVHRETDLPTKPFGVPTWQSAFRWLREKYGIDGFVQVEPLNKKYGFVVYNRKIQNYTEYKRNMSIEEAELQCLVKLIEIIENKH